MLYEFSIVDVFTSSPFAGNQLAVLPNAQGIGSQGMQLIAREFNFAETTFVLPPNNPANTRRVRIFTPRAEIDFAGHPTVGTACALVAGNHVVAKDLVFEEGVGPIRVTVTDVDDQLGAELTSTAPLTAPGTDPDATELAQVLSVDPGQVVAGFYASVGLGFCFIRLAGIEAVDRAAINLGAWAELIAMPGPQTCSSSPETQPVKRRSTPGCVHPDMGSMRIQRPEARLLLL